MDRMLKASLAACGLAMVAALVWILAPGDAMLAAPLAVAGIVAAIALDA